MTANESTPGVLVNAPVKFAGATPGVIVTPMPPAGVPVEGLPQASFREVIRRDGSREGAIQAVVDPPLGGNYLNIALYMKGPRDAQPQLIERKPVAPADQNDRVYFHVYQSLLNNDGVYVFTYVVERTSGNSAPSTESWALYHRDLPGGNDVPGTGSHPNLNISLPPELGNPPQIGKDEVDRGVAVTLSYPFMKAYDVITLELNRERFSYTVQPGEEGKPYVVTVTRSLFEQAGSHPEFPFSFTVVSQVNNPTHKRRWSIVIKANVNTERVTLAKAILREIPTENNDDPNTVDLAKLNGNPLSALIHLVETIWKAGDSIKLVFTAELNGSVVATHEETSPITQVPNQFLWSVPNNKIIANSTVKVVYEQIRGGAVIATSTPATAQVIGEGAIKLTPPTLVAPAVNPIDVWSYSTGVTVRIEFLTALTGDRAQLIEINPQPGATPFPAVAFNVNKRTNTVLSQAFLAARHGKQLTFRWALIRGGKEIARSGPLVLNVKRIVDGDARFPTPVIVGQAGPELDVTKLVATDKLSLAAWPLQASGQYVWLRYDGFNSSGAPIFFDDLNGVLHNEAQGLNRPALVAWLGALQHGTKVTISFRVNLGKVADLSAAVTFPVRNYTVRSAIAINPPTTPTNPVDPLSFVNGVTVRVDAAVVQPGDQAQLILLNPLPGSVAFPVLPLDQKYAIFTLDAKFLGQWHGNVAQLAWVWIRGGKEIARSGPLVLNVKRIVDGDARFPTPVIVGQTGLELDVTKLVATDKLSIAAWPLQVPGQYVWLRYDGFNSSGAPVFFEDLKGVPSNPVQGLSRPVPLDWLKTLKHGADVTIKFKVNFAMNADERAAATFPARRYTVKVVPDIPELIVDTSLLSLKGENFTFRNFLSYTGDDAVGTAANRAASGGVPPYTYESSNRKIATVDSNGVVRSEGNGKATIWVRDFARQQKSFEVETANVTYIDVTPSIALANARAYIQQVGGSMIANSLTDRRLQIASKRTLAFAVGIGIISPDNPRTQIGIARSTGEVAKFTTFSPRADGTFNIQYWINKPASF